MSAGVPLLEARKLTKVYRPQEEARGETDGAAEVRALDGVTLRIHAGEYVAIVGPSGSGKSTLMQVLGLLDRPTSGELHVGGQSVARLTDDQLATLRNRSIGFIFQFFNLLARTSAIANVALPLIYARHRDPQGHARALLQKVGMGDRLFHAPHQLSGGQQQRVAIARALANSPRILFADEPTGNISTAQAAEVMAELDRLNREGVTVIVVTHEEDIARHARRTITMRDGRIVTDRVRRQGRRVREERVAVGRASALPSRDALVENLRMALTALGLNKLRTFLTTLGVLGGVGAVISMTAIGDGAKAAVKARLASLGSNLLVVQAGSGNIRGTGGAPRFTLQDVQVLKTLSQGMGYVKYVDPTVQGNVVVSAGDKNWATRVTGCQPVYEVMRASRPVTGRFFTDAEDQARARVCLIGNTIIRNLYAEGFDPTGTLIKINKTNYRVLGILPVKGGGGFRDEDDVVIVPLNTAMNRILGQTTISSIDIEASSSETIQDAINEVTDVLRRTRHIPPGKDDDFNVRNMADIQAAMEGTTQTLGLLISGIAVVSLVVGGIGIMNIMLVSVRERTKEIGLRKALGAHNLEVLFQFLVEAVLIGVFGGAAGIVIGAGVALGFSLVAGWPILLPWLTVMGAAVISALTGIVAGLWPAWQASRLSPIEALRYE
ncbi:MAG: ABC transporter permease [Candidatus Coatesbacteria bacterium]